MTDRARQGIRSGFAGTARRLVLRSLAASTFFLAAAIALSATNSSWASRIRSDAAAMKASVSQGLFQVAHRHDTSRDMASDDYVQGLARLGIIAPR